MSNKKELKCPFCGGDVRVHVCDDEGNLRSEEYESDPWSGLGYMLIHDINDVPDGVWCPVATWEDSCLGTQIYDTRKEAINAFKIAKQINGQT